ncbi:MAG: formylglycine-generating enzyme family protein, partial [Chitinivibrionia bacterium]|nr:formylglycine-generating enzyme family protein [Chitinivibrionia bacterium]
GGGGKRDFWKEPPLKRIKNALKTHFNFQLRQGKNLMKKAYFLYFFILCFLPVKSFGQAQNNVGEYDEKITAKVINGIECVLVKAGTFTMGSPSNESNRKSDETQHQVTINQDFWISKYPVTNAQYGNSQNDNNPVVNITWTQANEWANGKGGQLPTEAQWEFAARGGVKSKGYIYSGGDNLDDVAWYHNNSSSGIKAVGQKKPNELGIYDMSGNVYEWCGDWYGSYPKNGSTKGVSRVMRGGSWSFDERHCRVASRYYGYQSYRSGSLGFRVVFSAN